MYEKTRDFWIKKYLFCKRKCIISKPKKNIRVSILQM